MALRCKRIADGVVFNHTPTIAEKKGFVVFEDDPQTDKEPVGLGSAPTLSLDPLNGLNRKEIGEYILGKYKLQIPKMGRKTDLILIDAYEIIEAYAEKEAGEKKEAAERDKIDEINAKKDAEPE